MVDNRKHYYLRVMDSYAQIYNYILNACVPACFAWEEIKKQLWQKRLRKLKK